MTTNQLFFALAGLFVTILVAQVAAIKYYIDAKIDGLDGKFHARFDSVNSRLDGLAGDVKGLMKYMIDHSERLATLEAKTKNL